MEHEPDNEFPSADEFWEKIEAVLAADCATHDDIDDALRSYLGLLNNHYRDFITTDEHLGHCAYLLYASQLFTLHGSYIRQQLVYCLLQEEEICALRIAVTFLLADARENDSTFDLLNREGIFPRLVELIAHPREHEESMHRTLMELMYELARVQKITNHDMTCIDDDFVCRLFDIIELVSGDVNDPYHYPVIRVLLVLNEQFMVAAHDPDVIAKKSMPLTNKVVKVLSSYGHRYKTFGANIILLLNREDETSLQLLTLKLMYLLFTTPPTYQYFYTNDLRVLVDILVRNLLDLPEYAAALRHTYLRVLYPLLEHTQLQDPPYYKRLEIRKLLALLCGERVEGDDGTALAGTAWNHFEDVDETTKRLVRRCQTVSWLSDPDIHELVRVESPTDERMSEPDSPKSPSKPQPPQLPAPRKLRKRDSSKNSTLTIGGFLTPQLEGARQSSISMAEMAQHKEKPGVITPSRNPSLKHGLRQAIFTKKEKPPPPQARRSAFRRPKPQSMQSNTAGKMTAVTLETLNLPQTPGTERDESDLYEDAVEEQNEDSGSAAMIERGLGEDNQSTSEDGLAASHLEIDGVMPSDEHLKSTTKKPPPAPKARRGWRMRKSKDLEEERSKDPGKFSATLPSISVTTQNPLLPPAEGVSEGSPFSPIQEKTLDPGQPLQTELSPKQNGGKRSVSDAMNQAQIQAVQQVEECLEHTHISEQLATAHQSQQQQHPPRSSSLQHQQPTVPESPPLRRIVLAPPGQAPIRAVPGPRVDVEKSPFLSDDEQDETDEKAQEVDNKAALDVPLPAPRLRTRESWESFGDDD